VALGSQTVSVWKDARELGRESAAAAVELAAGKKVSKAAPWDGGEKKIKVMAEFLKPIPVTQKNLDVVVKAGWITKDALCKGVTDPKVTACK
jgi:D-xylose transport system substrate-binding protein